jgi:hypothetical protein
VLLLLLLYAAPNQHGTNTSQEAFAHHFGHPSSS